MGGPPCRKNTDHSLASDIEQQKQAHREEDHIMVYPTVQAYVPYHLWITEKFVHHRNGFCLLYVLIHFSPIFVFWQSF